MKTENIVKDVATYVAAVNEAIVNYKSAARELFETYKDAYLHLKGIELTQFLEEINLDATKKSKFQTICNAIAFGMPEDQLPESINAKYEMAKEFEVIRKKSKKSSDSSVKERTDAFIEKLNPSMTESQVKEVIKEHREETKPAPEPVVEETPVAKLDFDSEETPVDELPHPDDNSPVLTVNTPQGVFMKMVARREFADYETDEIEGLFARLYDFYDITYHAVEYVELKEAA